MARSTVAWTLRARQDLLGVLKYLVEEARARDAAVRLLDQLEEAARSLADFPDRGRIVPELGLPRRELLVGRYRLIYRVRSEVEILRLIHAKQDFLETWARGRDSDR